MTVKNGADKVKAVLKGKVSSEEHKELSDFYLHECNLVKVPRLPTTLLYLFPRLAEKIAQRKAKPVSSQWNEESKQTNAYRNSVENLTPPGADLIPTRVKRWQLRGYHTIIRKIQTLSHTTRSDHQYKTTLLQEEKPSITSQTSQDALWEEMIKTREERQFQIGHVTKNHL